MIVTDSYQLVFDYWKDPLIEQENEEIPRFILEADKGLPLYVLVSHHHKDHFNKSIFRWESLFTSVKYILSKDVARHIAYMLKPTSTFTGIRPTPDNVIILKPGMIYSDEILKIEAFGSTDIGNSYYLSGSQLQNASNQTFFHAGDLNAWIWKDESSPAEINEAVTAYESILKTIADNHPEIDFVMFPVDSRIGSDYFMGAAKFVSRIDVKHFFPMHFGLGETSEIQNRYTYDACSIERYANKKRGEYICLTTPYSSFAKF